MKAALLTTYAKLNHGSLLEKYPNLMDLNYHAQKDILEIYNYWPKSWNQALERIGFEMLTLPILNGGSLFQKWCAENNIPYIDDETTIIEMLKQHKPELLIYNHHFSRFLSRIRTEVPTIRKVVSMLGTATVDWDLYKYVDLSITCSLTFVAQNAEKGIKSYRIHHAFNPQILEHLQPKPEQSSHPFIFIGSVQRRKHYHYEREELLKLLVKKTPIIIYSPSVYFDWKDDLKTIAKQIVYVALTPIRAIPPLYSRLNRIKKFEKILTLQDFPRFPVDKSLQKKMRPAVIGYDMFQTLRDSELVFNVHLDGQTSASNMRQFEVTGAGACLLTDYKPDLPDIFIPDEEVVTYHSPPEAVEKVIWLLNHPQEMRKIALAGHKRTLKDHTFDNRALELKTLLHEKLKIQP